MDSDAEPQELPESANRAIDFFMEYSEEPPHVAVMLATGRMEFLLGQVLRGRLLPCPGSRDTLLDSERAVGTFSARIDLAHRLGVIDASLARTLHLYRKIRNDFAHTFQVQELDSSPHADRISELSRGLRGVASYQRVRSTYLEGSPHSSPAGADFVVTGSFVIALLEEAVDAVERVDDECATNLSWSV